MGTTAGSWASETDASAYGGYFSWAESRGVDASYNSAIWSPGNFPYSSTDKIGIDGTTASGSGTDGSVCPDGWRLPTRKEWADLIGFQTSASSGAVGAGSGGFEIRFNDVDGWVAVGDNGALFFPFAGGNGGDGKGTLIYYWSNTEADSYAAYFVYFMSTGTFGRLNSNRKTYYYAIRCVKSAF